jgi:SAM-dependent methyltransferase
MVSPRVQEASYAPPPCWVCGSREAERWKERNLDRPLTPEDLRITDDRYGVTLSLWRCRACEFIHADDIDVGELVSLYARLDDPAYEEGEGSRTLQMRWLVKSAVQARPAARTLLDVGAAAGMLVKEAARAGLDGEGVEPSRALVRAGRRGGVRLHEGVLPHPDLLGRDFDMVTLIDVIEHVSDPVGLLECAREMVASGGIVAVVTPDVGSLAARLLGRRWWHFRLAHVGYFNRRSLDEAVRVAGLETEREFRARWFFEVGYLADRLGRYLPMAGLNRLMRRTPLLRSLYDLVIPLNLRDSFVRVLRPAAAPLAAAR